MFIHKTCSWQLTFLAFKDCSSVIRVSLFLGRLFNRSIGRSIDQSPNWPIDWLLITKSRLPKTNHCCP